MEQNTKEKQIIAQLNNGRKTWTQLTLNVKMSRETLSRTLKSLMVQGTVIKYGTVEFGKIVDYYDLAKKKEPAIALKVLTIFEKEDYLIFPIKTLKDLGIEQSLVQWFHHSFKVLMHFARKILDLRFAKELSPKQRIEYTDYWKSEAVSYASKWMDGFMEEFIQYSNESWIEVFGKYEDNPKQFLQAMVKFSEIIGQSKNESD